MLEIILIGIALSMDAFAVTLSAPMIYKNLTKKQSISLPVAFGFFQGLMPILGYYLGTCFSDFLTRFSGIISFLILAFIGGNMIKEAFCTEDCKIVKFGLRVLLLQAIATSIDAFAVGVSFAAKNEDILSASAIIAVSTLIITSIALPLGKLAQKKLGEKSEILGGIILIAIGLKSLFGL